MSTPRSAQSLEFLRVFRFLVTLCLVAAGMLMVACGGSGESVVNPNPTVTPTPQAIQLTVRGSVTDSVGMPFAGATVAMSGARPVTPATSAADGTFTLSAEAGTYLFSISHSSRTLVTQSVNVGSTTVELGAIRLPKVNVTGVVNDTGGQPVGGAEVAAIDASATAAKTFGAARQALVKAAAESAVVTAADGSFTLQLDPGTYGLTIRLNNMVLLDTGLVATQEPFQSVGALIVNTDFNVDTDNDGLADVVETNGWDILLDEFGTGEYTRRHVSSDPAIADSDNDTLGDQIEYAYKTDPRRRDTDGDALTDTAELNVYFSHPASVDSDADARGPQGTAFPNPRLFDGSEANRPCAVPVAAGQVNVCATSPILADSDGDGLTDHEEIIGGGFNPLRADLPNVQLDVAGDPVAVLNIDFEGGVESKSVQSVLERESTERVVTDTKTDKYSLEFGYKAEVGVSGVKVNASASWEFKAAMAREASHTTSSTAARESQKNLEEAIGRNEVQRYRDGTLAVPMRLRNSSNLSVRVSSLDIIASRVRPSTYGSTSLLGTLVPKNLPAGGWTLSPGSDVLFEATNEELNGLLMQPVIANPAAMQFDVGVLQMHQIDASGAPIKDFSAVGQAVLERCGLVVIDYGNGRIDRHAIATNVFRNPDGSSMGLNLLQALQNIAGLEVELADDRRFVRRIGSVSGGTTGSYWAIAGEGPEFALDSPVPFDEIALKHGQRITLMFQGDSDGDGLPDREERLLGTGPTADSDGDGISDWDEVKVGWDVSFKDLEGNTIAGLTRRVFSDPRLTDADGDNLSDLEERSAEGRDATDPNLPDTDLDGTSDSLDSTADAQEIAGSPRVGLVRYYPMDFADKISGGSGEPPFDSPFHLRDHAGQQDAYFVIDGAGRHCHAEPYIYGTWQSFVPYNIGYDSAGLYSFANRHNVLQTASYFFYNYGQTRDIWGNADSPCVTLWLAPQVRPSEVPVGGSVTLSAWLYLNPTHATGPHYSYDLPWDPATDPGWNAYILHEGRFSLVLRNGMIRFSYQTGAGPQDVLEVADTERLERRRWHHYVGVFDANTSVAKLYRDGVVVARASGSVDVGGINPSSDWPFGIGGSAEGRAAYNALLGHPERIWKGGMDEVRLYNRALSDDEIIRLMEDSGPVPPPQP